MRTKPAVASEWVVNASPLITLAKVGRLDLLVGPGHTLVIPEAVHGEVLQGPDDDPARRALETGLDALVVAATLVLSAS